MCITVAPSVKSKKIKPRALCLLYLDYVGGYTLGITKTHRPIHQETADRTVYKLFQFQFLKKKSSLESWSRALQPPGSEVQKAAIWRRH